MTYIPYAPETGAFYTLTGPDGTVATFNNPDDPFYSGILTDVTGLDSADVREAGDVLAGADGGYHGDFFYGRRPITLTGSVVNVASADDRAYKVDQIRRACNAMRADAVLSWQNTASTSIPMQTWVRLQQPLRVTGAWIKTFQISLVSQYSQLFSSALNFQSTQNLITNGTFEASPATTGWTSATSYLLNSGATLASSSTNHSGAQSVLVTTTSASTHQGIQSSSFTVQAGQTYTCQCYMRASTSGNAVELAAGGTALAQTYTISGTVNTGWALYSLTFTPVLNGTVNFSVRTPTASAKSFFIDDAMVTQGRSVQILNSPTTMNLENQGSGISYPVWTAWGPINTGTELQIDNGSTGDQISMFNTLSLPSGSWLTLDALQHTATGPGSNLASYIDFGNSTPRWPCVVSGQNQFGGLNFAYYTAAWRDTWI